MQCKRRKGRCGMWWLQCCREEDKGKCSEDAHSAARSDLQLLVVLAQLISTPRSAPHLPASAFFAHAPPQSNLDLISASQLSISTSRRQTGKASPQTHRLRKPPGGFATPD
ncbi:hypothetical protein TASIC1_0007004800 [Trichoderma asperellum]|uniref:Uncharacterized protein n=1 Tax=Trichoderma asperellum TaxID=101201 RepID=A0A6V8QXL4_TRIAP|nr:hypothetical protein TASIC1_0007004800 [Trichoderma asperellum]